MALSVVEKFSVKSPTHTDEFDQWQCEFANSLVGDKFWPTTTLDGFKGALQRRWVDDLLFVQFRTNGFGGRFNSNSPSSEYIGFGFPDLNEHVTFRDGHTINIPPGCFIWDVAQIRDFTNTGEGGACYIFMPRSVLRTTAIRELLGSGFGAPENASVLKIIRGLASSVCSGSEPLTPTAAASIRNAFLELLAGTTSAASNSTNAAVSDAMRTNIERWVETNLVVGDLSPSDAAAAHGISVRSLHRLFSATDDSFGSLVRRKRVDRARQDLLRGGESVQATAMRWRYADASHFCREFKKYYQQTPSEYRDSQLTAS